VSETKKQDVRFGEIARFVWGYWRKTPLTSATIIGSLLIAVTFDVALPSVTRQLTEAVAKGDQHGAMVALLTFLGCGIGFAVSWQIGYRLLCKAIVMHMKTLMQDGYAWVQQASSDWHANSFAGATTTKLTRGMRAFDGFSDTIMAGIVPTSALVLGSLAMMALQWPVMGLAVGISITLYVLVAATMARFYIVPSNREGNRHDSLLSAALADAITCNPTVKSFGAEAREEKRLAGTLDKWGVAVRRSWLRRQDMYGVMTVMSLLNQLAILGMPVWLWTKGQAGPAEVAYAVTAFFLIHGAVRNVGNFTQNLQKATNDMEDIVVFCRMPLNVADHADAQLARVEKGEVRFRNVGFRYAGQDSAIYHNLNLVIRPGEKVGLVGASGSGKSTFVKLLQRLYDVTEGAVLVDGQDVRHLTQSSLRAKIALVPQEPVLFHRSLLDNIRYGRVEASEDEVIAAARKAHAHDFIARLPDGYATLVGERGIKLSGGERQRVAIARAILANAPLLVLDEATSSLDSVSEALIQDALEQLMEGRTTLIVAHRLSTLRAVDRILVFDRGQIVEEGTHEELLASVKGRYRALYQTQQLGLAEPEAVTV
jgi:ATP-binding cassette subfamily B protein